MPNRPPIPLCSLILGPDWVDDGTRCRSRTSPPGGTGIKEVVGVLVRPFVLPAASTVPARNLSRDQARDLVVYYALNDQIHLDMPVTFGIDGKPTSPKVTAKVRLDLKNIGGVQFTPNNPAAAKWKQTKPLDMRLVVLLVRLSQYLRSGRWGVTTIFWGGLGTGRGNPNDLRHEKGYALDFHGATTNFGKLDVYKDWGTQGITLPNGKKAKDNTWPSGVSPYFRLDVNTDAGGFFYDVYHFLTGQATDAASSTSIGSRSSILHPDHPNPTLRLSHRDHIHCEIDR